MVLIEFCLRIPLMTVAVFGHLTESILRSILGKTIPPYIWWIVMGVIHSNWFHPFRTLHWLGNPVWSRISKPVVWRGFVVASPPKSLYIRTIFACLYWIFVLYWTSLYLLAVKSASHRSFMNMLDSFLGILSTIHKRNRAIGKVGGRHPLGGCSRSIRCEQRQSASFPLPKRQIWHKNVHFAKKLPQRRRLAIHPAVLCTITA